MRCYKSCFQASRDPVIIENTGVILWHCSPCTLPLPVSLPYGTVHTSTACVPPLWHCPHFHCLCPFLQEKNNNNIDNDDNFAPAEGDDDGVCLTPKQLRFALPTPPLLGDISPMVEAPCPPLLMADSDEDEHSDLDVQLEPYISSCHATTVSTTRTRYFNNIIVINCDDSL